jgi:hypothetical protein
MSARIAPWTDHLGQPVHHGARLSHPDGTEFVAVHLSGYDSESDAWRAVYDDATVSRLCLQIGDKGQAFVASPPANPEGGVWTIFNSGGAVVRDDCTLEEVRDYMTPERFERGWNAICCINVTSQAQLDKLDMEKQ